MNRRLTTGWSLPFVLVVYAAALSWIAWQSLRLNDGVFTYAQDDPYIHLSMARTLAWSGVWGISPDAFAGASSSPLWTLVLSAVMAVGGAAVWWPLVLNIVAGAALIVFMHRQLEASLDEPAKTTALLIFLFVLPLPTLVFIGMEHTLHVLVVLAFAIGAARRLADDGLGDRVWAGGLVLAALASGLRYEGLFVVAAVAGLALLRRRLVTAFALVAAASVPVALYALYSVANGSWVLPNSIVIKSGAERFGSGGGLLSILTSWVNVFLVYQRPSQVALLLVVAALTAITAARTRPAWNVPHVLAGIFAGAELLHVCLITNEWFYRYEAYTMALGMAAAIFAAADLRRSGWTPALAEGPVARAAIGVAAIVIAIPLMVRAGSSLASTPAACGEIYRQQYQMGQLLRERYGGEAVALNDIGAVSWMADLEIVDLIGLATNDVADARRSGRMGADFVRALAEREQVAAVAVHAWYFRGRGELPAAWIEVGEWQLASAHAVAGPIVTFFAPSVDHERRLREALDAYQTRLPAGITYVPLGRERGIW